MSAALTSDFKPIPLPDFVERSPEEMQRRAAEFYETIRRRHTVREFSPRPVPRQLIETCLAAAGTAPSKIVETSFIASPVIIGAP